MILRDFFFFSLFLFCQKKSSFFGLVLCSGNTFSSFLVKLQFNSVEMVENLLFFKITICIVYTRIVEEFMFFQGKICCRYSWITMNEEKIILKGLYSFTWKLLAWNWWLIYCLKKLHFNKRSLKFYQKLKFQLNQFWKNPSKLYENLNTFIYSFFIYCLLSKLQ